MTGLVEALTQAKPARSTVEGVLKSLDVKSRKAFDAALRDPERVSANALAAIMADHGKPIGRTAIDSWRRRNLKGKS